MVYSGEKKESWEVKYYISRTCPPATWVFHLKKKEELPISHQHIAYEIKQGAHNVWSSIRGGAFALDPQSMQDRI